MNNIPKILIIAGPTASGKTKLAMAVSKVIPSVLISADSRQVYKHMDVVTGKDHDPTIPIAGIDIVEPNKEISVAKWLNIVRPVIKQAQINNRLPIVVGGTGLYIKSLTKNIDTLGIKPNQQLRKELSQLSVNELQDKLTKINPKRFQEMNNSDANNPRRLIRAIEIATHPHLHPTQTTNNNQDILSIGLSTSISKIKMYIKKRVIARLKDCSAIYETKQLLEQSKVSPQALTAIGYGPITKYLNGELSKDELIRDWTQSELSYAKRQLTWFNKQKNFEWYNSHDPRVFPQVVKRVKTWYYEN